MKTIKDKQILVGADFAGYPLKEAVVAHLKEYGWTVTDVGVRSPESMYRTMKFTMRIMISRNRNQRMCLLCTGTTV